MTCKKKKKKDLLVKQLQKENNSLKTRLQQIEPVITINHEIRSKVADIQHKYNHSKAERIELTHKIDILKNMSRKLAQEKQTAITKYDKLQAQFNSLSKKLKEIKDLNNFLQELSKKDQEKMVEMADEINRYAKEASLLETNNNILMQHNIKIMESYEKLHRNAEHFSKIYNVDIFNIEKTIEAKNGQKIYLKRKNAIPKPNDYMSRHINNAEITEEKTYQTTKKNNYI